MADIETTKEDYAELNYHLQMESLRLSAELDKSIEYADSLHNENIQAKNEIETLKEENKILSDNKFGEGSHEDILERIMKVGGDSVLTT